MEHRGHPSAGLRAHRGLPAASEAPQRGGAQGALHRVARLEGESGSENCFFFFFCEKEKHLKQSSLVVLSGYFGGSRSFFFFFWIFFSFFLRVVLFLGCFVLWTDVEKIRWAWSGLVGVFRS